MKIELGYSVEGYHDDENSYEGRTIFAPLFCEDSWSNEAYADECARHHFFAHTDELYLWPLKFHVWKGEEYLGRFEAEASNMVVFDVQSIGQKNEVTENG